jgi:NTP pyrophosphatase (non-canonical NTP hydrolase)
MECEDFQTLMRELYYDRDNQRGVGKMFMRITEELGELGRAIRNHDEPGMKEEMADVLAWLFSLGNILGLDMEEAVLSKYDKVCPRCQKNPCECPFP